MNLIKFGVLFAMYAQAQAGESVELPKPDPLPVQQEGLASWYGGGDGDGGLHGRITATGEVFNPAERTCASRTIPLNTVVLVEDVRTGTRTWCRVNDRGPYGAMHEGEWVIKTRRSQPGVWRGIMDLSRGTAESFGFSQYTGRNPIRVRYYTGSYGERYPKPIAWQVALGAP